MSGEELETALTVAVVGVALYLAYKATRVGLGAISDASQAVADNVTAPVIDWSNSASNPFSDNAEEQRFHDAVDAELQNRSLDKLTNREWWIARGYCPSVAMFGPAKQYKDNWFITPSDADCINAAADNIAGRRAGTVTSST